MRAAFAAMALRLPATLAPAQSSQDFDKQVDRGVADMSKSRVKQLPSGNWLRERFQVDPTTQSAQQPETAGTPPSGVLRDLRARCVKHPGRKFD